MGNKQSLETPVVREALRTLRHALPRGWEATLAPTHPGDYVLTLRNETGVVAQYVIEAKGSGRASAQAIAAQADFAARASGLPALVFTDYANPTLRATLDDVAIGYVDGTGWIHLEHRDPLVLIGLRGAERAPRATKTTVSRLDGRAASAIVRALLVTSIPVGVRELAEIARTSPGSVSKVLPTLQADGAVERNDQGAVTSLRRRTLFERWIQDYTFLRSNGVVLDFLAPRGPSGFVVDLTGRDDICITGSAAARVYLREGVAPVLPLTHVACFVTDPARLAGEHGLVRADRRTSNVLLTAPKEPRLITDPTIAPSGLRVAPLVQALADLYSLPGRGAAEAEQLIEQLAADDESWAR